MKIVLFSLSLALSLLLNFFVFKNIYFPALILVWIASFIFFALSFKNKSKSKLKIRFNSEKVFTTLILFLPILVRLINLNIYRIHDDEFITSYFSSHFNLANNFFGPVPSEVGQWVSQFPSLYFALQKTFFSLFGETFLTVKLSVLPYVFIVSLMLYLIVKRLMNREIALLSVVTYSFLAIDVYFDTLALHFISSTASFLVFFYFALLNFQKPSKLHSALAGITCAFCYLFYLSSYIAFPILFIFFFVQFFRENKIEVLRNFSIVLLGFFLTLSPFLVYAFKYNPYFFQRYNQVNLTQGEWSIEKGRASAEGAFPVIKDNLVRSVISLYRSDIGGAGGYSFGHLAMFDYFSLFLLILGVALLVLYSLRKLEHLFILVTILISFILGMVLTIPPPAFHRPSVSFPFISFLIALPIYFVFSYRKFYHRVKYLFLAFLLIVFCIQNQNYFSRAVERDKEQHIEYLEDVKVMRFIEDNFSESRVHVAAYPTYALQKTYYFFNRNRRVDTDFHDNYLEKFNTNEKYVYIILFPDRFNEKFEEADPNGKLIDDISTKYSLFAN